MLLEVLPPLDWDKAGTETWRDVVRQIGKTGAGKFIGSLFSKDKVKKKEVWDSVFKTIRQSDWWQGDSEYHAPGYQELVSELERRFRNGEFVVAIEVTPPLNANTEKLSKDIDMVKPYARAINFTDSSSARSRMSSIAYSKVAVNHYVEPVFQFAARDTTRSGL